MPKVRPIKARAETWRELLAAFPDAARVLFASTSYRQDGRDISLYSLRPFNHVSEPRARLAAPARSASLFDHAEKPDPD